MSRTTVGGPGTPQRYAHSLWLLSARDLKVRYATSMLGYLWSVLDPLVMSLIYLMVFTFFFKKDVGAEPYIVYLIAGLLPWVWFNTSVSDFTRAFRKDAKLVRSTSIPRSIWINRIVLSKGIEFLCSLPVLALFVIIDMLVETDPARTAHIGWGLLLLPVAIIMQTVLLVGLGMLVAPLCVMFTDLERTTALILRALFYATPVIYSVQNLPEPFQSILSFNPLTGIFMLYRAAFFPELVELGPVLISTGMCAAFLALGVWTFRTLERPVLKEL
ncbi:ABC transporter permease [uncultured Microbacterium sp.]|uniref:ABC transporter permease n=1 Tax=uncultured Microbacterium sp. TaxID=191216 RepID=UPI0026279F33|nr:ABC transporter permease [uncultured Microbacterium sp.]